MVNNLIRIIKNIHRSNNNDKIKIDDKLLEIKGLYLYLYLIKSDNSYV